MRLVAAGALAVVAGILLAVLLPSSAPAEDIAPLNAPVVTGATLPDPEVVRAGVDRPTWRVGDAREITVPTGETCTLVVYAANESGYGQGVACRFETRVAAEAATALAGFFGPLDLDLSAKTPDATRWFDWPLTDEKTWTTRFQGEDVAIQAKFVPDLEGPDGPTPGYRMMMVAMPFGGVGAVYDYLPATGWWHQVAFNDGIITVGDTTTGWNGTVITAIASERIHSIDAATNPNPNPMRAFTQPDDDTEIRIGIRVVGFHIGRIQLQTPDGRTVYDAGIGNIPVAAPGGDRAFSAMTPSEPGVWRLVKAIASATGSVTISVHGIRYESHEIGTASGDILSPPPTVRV